MAEERIESTIEDGISDNPIEEMPWTPIKARFEREQGCIEVYFFGSWWPIQASMEEAVAKEFKKETRQFIRQFHRRLRLIK